LKADSTPLNLNNVTPEIYSFLVLPHSPGAVFDLADNKQLGEVLRNFVKNQKPICAIGMGVVGLFSAFENGKIWCFNRFTMTTLSVFELASSAESFAKLPLIPEDVIKERGGLYSCTNSNRTVEVHVVVDRQLITGQNEKSTTAAIQNLKTLCNQKYSKDK